MFIVMTSPRPAHLAAAEVPVARGPRTAQSDVLNGGEASVTLPHARHKRQLQSLK